MSDSIIQDIRRGKLSVKEMAEITNYLELFNKEQLKAACMDAALKLVDSETDGFQKTAREIKALLPQARPFVIENGATGRSPERHVIEGPLSLPFPVCSFEVAGKNGRILDDPEQGHLAYVIFSEHSPGKLSTYALYTQMDPYPMAPFIVSGAIKDSSNSYYAKLAKYLVDVMYSSRLVEETTDQTVKVRSRFGDVTGNKKINYFVRIVPKSFLSRKPKTLYGGEVYYSHRWETMGHWRKVSGLGKDRDGIYNTVGFTWVIPHTKGPVDKPLIVKPRIILK